MSSPDVTPIAAVMSGAHAAFEAMVEVLHGRWPDAGPLTGSFVMAAAAAADGRDALATAPAASLLAPVPYPRLLVPGHRAGPAAAAEAVAAVAARLAEELAAALPAARDPGDRRAMHAACRAAAEVRDHLSAAP